MRAFGYPAELAFKLSKRMHCTPPPTGPTRCEDGLARRARRRRRRPARPLRAHRDARVRGPAAPALDPSRRLRPLLRAARRLPADRADDDGPHDPPVRQGRSRRSGVPKFDFLGLGGPLGGEARVRRDRGADRRSALELYHLPQDDQKTYELISRGETIGTFQIESRGPDRVDRAHQTRAPVRHRRAGRAHPAGPDPGEVRPPLHEAAARARGGDVRRTRTSSRSSSAPTASRSSRSRRWRSRWRSAATAPCEADELRRTMGNERKLAKLKAALQHLRARMEARGVDPATAEAIVRGPDELRELRLPREPRLELRAHRVRDGVAQGAPPGRLPARPAERVADGLLCPVHARARRPAPRRRGPASLPRTGRLGQHAGRDG